MTSITADQPLARSADLVVEGLNDEVLVYDLGSDRAHSLSGPVARIWRACDGHTSSAALSDAVGLDPETVARGLAELADCDLLTQGHVREGATRREVTVRMVRAGAAVAAAPLIISVMAPTPAMAATPGQCAAGGGQNCGNDCHQLGCCCCVPPGQVKLCVPDVSFCPGGAAESTCN